MENSDDDDHADYDDDESSDDGAVLENLEKETKDIRKRKNRAVSKYTLKKVWNLPVLFITWILLFLRMWMDLMLPHQRREKTTRHLIYNGPQQPKK